MIFIGSKDQNCPTVSRNLYTENVNGVGEETVERAFFDDLAPSNVPIYMHRTLGAFRITKMKAIMAFQSTPTCHPSSSSPQLPCLRPFATHLRCQKYFSVSRRTNRNKTSSGSIVLRMLTRKFGGGRTCHNLP